VKFYMYVCSSCSKGIKFCRKPDIKTFTFVKMYNKKIQYIDFGKNTYK